MRNLIRRARTFISHEIWDIDPKRLSRLRALIVRLARMTSIVVWGVIETGCHTRAWALTSITLLSIVPFLAFIFAFGKGLGVRTMVESQLRTLFPMGAPTVPVDISGELREDLVKTAESLHEARAKGSLVEAQRIANELEAKVARAVEDARIRAEEALRTVAAAEEKRQTEEYTRLSSVVGEDPKRQIRLLRLEIDLEAARRAGADSKEIERLQHAIQGDTAGVDIIGKILEYVDKTPVGALGTLGFLLLLWTFLKLLGTVEASFNHLWGIRTSRNIYRKFSDYLSVSAIALMALACSSAANVSLQASAIVDWIDEVLHAGFLVHLGLRLLPFFTLWFGFTLIYMLMPNTRVRPVSAAVGGFVGGACWQTAQWAYITFQVGVSKYNAIYGAFATFPIFMVWLYVSWLILLVGAEVSFAHQNEKTYSRESRALAASPAFRERLALEIASRVARRFHNGELPLTDEELASDLDVPIRLVRDVIHVFTEQRFFSIVEGEVRAVEPARSLDRIRVEEILFALRTHGGGRGALDVQEKVKEVVGIVEDSLSRSLSGLTLLDLAKGGEPRVGSGGASR